MTSRTEPDVMKRLRREQPVFVARQRPERGCIKFPTLPPGHPGAIDQSPSGHLTPPLGKGNLKLKPFSHELRLCGQGPSRPEQPSEPATRQRPPLRGFLVRK